MTWKTRLTQSFPCKVPLVGAPMAGVSGGLLAAETCRAGALGLIAGGYLQSLEALEEEIRIFRQHAPPESPLCIGFIGHAALKSEQGWKRYEQILDTHRPNVVQFFAPSIISRSTNGNTNVDLAHQYKAKFIAQVGNVKEALQALEAGADCLIAQGSEAGGHGLRSELGSGTIALASKVVSLRPDVPVVAAGGIVNGRGVAAALALGCDGAVLGTRLWASQESIGRPDLQRQLVQATSCDQVIRTTVFDHIQNQYLTTPWPAPYDSVGALRNKTSKEWDGRPDELAAELGKEGSTLVSDYQKADKESNVEIVKVLAGEGVGEINSIEPAYDIVKGMDEETKSILREMPKLIE